MESALEIYRSSLVGLPVCEDSWFARELAKYRSGNSEARGRILSSCLPTVLRIAESNWREDCGIPLLDLMQEGNAELVRALKEFSGCGASEFVQYVEGRVQYRITLWVEHPSLYEYW